MITKYTSSNARLTPVDARIRPSLSMQPYGQFRINRPLVKLLGLAPGKHIQILHDESSGEWYIAPCGIDGLPLRRSKNAGATFSSVVVCEAIQKDLGLEKGRFDVLTDPTIVDGTKCFCILLSSAKQRAMKVA